MKRLLSVFLTLIVCAGKLPAQTYTYTDTDEWQAYDDFNRVFLDTKNSKYIYRDHSARTNAVDRWNGAAAIWCQAIFYDMAVNAYRRAVQEGNATLKTKYKNIAQRIYTGEKKQYCNFDFDNNNTNTGWFVYDDIMWWTCALARAHVTFGGSTTSYPYRTEAERSFLRVWYGSTKVGDDGSYADPARGLGGGMFWEWQPIDNPKAHKAGDFRSACINFPTVIAACLLHKIVPEGRKEPATTGRPTQQTKEWYLEKAKEIFAGQKAKIAEMTAKAEENAKIAEALKMDLATSEKQATELSEKVSFLEGENATLGGKLDKIAEIVAE